MGAGCAVTHSCSQSDVDAGRTKLVVGDVTGGVGIVAAAIGAGILVFGGPRAAAPASGAAAIDVRVSSRGAGLDVTGRF
jgi:hypothetical protein